MAFQLENQHPQTFYTHKPNLPLIDVSVDANEYDQQLKAHSFELLVRPLYTPKSNQHQVAIRDDVTNNTIDPRTFTEALLHFLRTDVIDQDLTHDLHQLYKQGSQHPLDSELSFDQFLVLEALDSLNQPYPEKGRVIYMPGEIVGAAKKLHTELNKVTPVDLDTLRSNWFGKLGAYISQFHLSNFRLITVKDNQTFEDLKTNIRKYMKQGAPFPSDTARHVNQFTQMTLDGELSVGLFLPHELEDEAYGFNRILEHELAKMERRKNQRVFSEMYSLKGLLRPTKLIILNLEEYSDARNLQKEWQQIVRAFNNTHKIRHIKNKNLQSIQSVNREVSTPTSYDGGDRAFGKDAMRSDKISFLTKPQMSKKQLAKRISDIAKKHTLNQTTSNFKKKQKNTFMRANRRNPDDINAQGKISSTKYSPDVHIWLDSSASISKSDYEAEIYTMITIAKHMNVDMYFNSFSHVVSETVKIPTKNRTPKQIFALVEHVDKVAGGTDFINVWEAIDKTEAANIKTGMAPRIHLVLSDMDYFIPTSYTLQPHRPSVKNTYYIPIRIRRDIDRAHVQRFAKALNERGGNGLATSRILF